MNEVILFEHANFHGAHKHVFGREPNLNAEDDNFFNDRVSSIVVISGNWAFYRHAGFDGQYARILGPGTYPFVEDVDIQNDDISSLQPV
ncbi:beta/gamma crystallin-related protein [Pannus brasiliensis CCIBt3594]|uniref:Beta/gamma crystallin-related protein n=1 Tax=Pannus brasiliensis CCIBt3594 TaxID=1427578 RepID=A0AAW9QHN9_9CHRO